MCLMEINDKAVRKYEKQEIRKKVTYQRTHVINYISPYQNKLWSYMKKSGFHFHFRMHTQS